MPVCTSRMYSVKRKRGGGLLNTLINKLPIELHIPGYQYCGPGTKLSERLARGDPGINPLDSACKDHDIAYSHNREDITARNAADKVLAGRAWKRVFAPDAGIGERAAALLVTNMMNAKSKVGMGAKNSRRRLKRKLKRRVKRKAPRKYKRIVKTRKRRKVRSSVKKVPKVTIQKIIQAARKAMTLNKGSNNAIKTALQGARDAVKLIGGRSRIRVPRVLRIHAKIGGVLPFLVPLFAGLSAAGAMAGGTAGIVKAVNEAAAAKRQLAESMRHNKTIEAIALGRGLYIKPYKTGMGLYLNSKN